MDYTQLGQSNLHGSKIAFGTWSFGGEWGAVQVEQTAPAADIHLTPQDLGEIDHIMRGAVAVGGPSPEAMP